MKFVRWRSCSLSGKLDACVAAGLFSQRPAAADSVGSLFGAEHNVSVCEGPTDALSDAEWEHLLGAPTNPYQGAT